MSMLGGKKHNRSKIKTFNPYHTRQQFERNFGAAMVSNRILHETIFNATLFETFEPRLLLDQYADNESTLVHTGTMSLPKEEKTYMYLQEKGIT